MISFLSIIFLIFLLGLSISLIFDVKNGLELWSLSWLLGTGTSTFLWFIIYQFLATPFTLKSLLIVLTASNLLCYAYIITFKNIHLISKIQKKLSFKKISLVIRNLRKNKFILLGSIILFVIFSFVLSQNLFWPVTDWDSLALYDFRAKVIVNTGSLDQGKELGYFFQYPLFTSLLHTITYLCGLYTVKIWYAIIYQAAVINFFVILRKRTSATMSMLGSVFFASSPLIFSHGFMAYTNLSYTIFTSFGFIYLWLWFDDNKRKNLFLGSLLVGLGTWVRISEPFYYLALVLVLVKFISIFVKIKEKIKSQIINMIIACTFILYTRYPWDRLINILFSSNLNTPIATLYMVNDWNLLYGKINEVTNYLVTYSLPVYSLYLFMAILLLINDIHKKNWNVLIKYLTLVVLLCLIFVGTLITSLWLESWNRIGDSLARMSMFLIPLLLYIIFSSPSWKSYIKE